MTKLVKSQLQNYYKKKITAKVRLMKKTWKNWKIKNQTLNQKIVQNGWMTLQTKYGPQVSFYKESADLPIFIIILSIHY